MTSGEPNPRVESIIDELPGALQKVVADDTELAAMRPDLDEVSNRQAELEHGQKTAATELALSHASRLFESYPRRLREVIRHVLAGEGKDLMITPPVEDCQRIAEVDSLVEAAAGQPVVVLKPGKDWIDVGLLEPRRDHGQNTGLQHSFSMRGGSAIVLPVHDSVTVDLRTGKEPDWDAKREDDELSNRDHLRLGAQPEPVRPAIDPLQTRILPAAEDTEPDEETGRTHVLVGYSYLRQVLNRVYGFDFDALKDSPEMEDYAKFQTALQLQERLETVAVRFDIDYIDGVLAYRINKAEQELAEGPFQGQSAPYQQSVLDGLRAKQARLAEEGWLTVGKP